MILGVWGGVPAGATSPKDQRAAQAGLLTLQDFPAGWTASPNSSNDNSATKKAIDTIAACKPFRPLLGNAKAGSRADAKSTFGLSGLSVSNNIVVFPTLAGANRTVRASKSGAFSACTQRLLQQGITQQLNDTGQAAEVQHLAVAVQLLSAGVSVGDDQSAVGATVTLSVGGTTTSLHVEDIFIRAGRAIDSFSYEDDTNPITDTVPSAISASVTRLAGALSS